MVPSKYAEVGGTIRQRCKKRGARGVRHCQQFFDGGYIPYVLCRVLHKTDITSMLHHAVVHGYGSYARGVLALYTFVLVHVWVTADPQKKKATPTITNGGGQSSVLGSANGSITFAAGVGCKKRATVVDKGMTAWRLPLECSFTPARPTQ